MSRARWAMYVFTDSELALRDAVTRPSKRLSSRDLPTSSLMDHGLDPAIVSGCNALCKLLCPRKHLPDESQVVWPWGVRFPTNCRSTARSRRSTREAWGSDRNGQSAITRTEHCISIPLFLRLASCSDATKSGDLDGQLGELKWNSD
jgi:hypothetical protein